MGQFLFMYIFSKSKSASVSGQSKDKYQCRTIRVVWHDMAVMDSS